MVELIKTELLRRKRDNKNYSLRAFAEFLEISPGRLSELISGKRPLSKKMKVKISQRLGLTEINNLLESQPRNLTFSDRSDYHFLSNDAFAVLADWYHFAILSLADTRDFQADPKWIAKRLGISALEAKEALNRLRNVGAIEFDGSKMKKTNKSVRAGNGLDSQALRISHRQSIEQALLSLNETPTDLRDITSITMAIDLKKLPLAKKIIQEFRHKMADVMEVGNQTEVYNLNIQLVPVSTRRTL
ncbi:TIGR02147 family protein [Bdellovibrio sp. HCB185ZH]|uniref:TIGR02147 family protein n=1 Tax=Bdellovibrio sp. HCB185ZH TaxID=3394235 RepID=UPI0039A48D88